MYWEIWRDSDNGSSLFAVYNNPKYTYEIVLADMKQIKEQYVEYDWRLIECKLRYTNRLGEIS